ncbi:MAG: AAA family ATPase [Bryobacterales bacterium]|nr:AAA family ATPase [Bryobacterales bacterium]
MLLNVGLVIGASNLLEVVRSALLEKSVSVALEQHEIGDWADFVEKLHRVRLDVLLLAFDQLSDPLEDVIRQIKATPSSPKVIVVHDSADPEAILKAIRATADEYLYPPLKEDLHRALDRMGIELRKDRAGTNPRGKVFGLLSAKGGCGATTLACHLATELYRQTGLEVLLADFDIHSGMVGFLMKSQGRYSIMDAIANVHRLDLSFWKALVSNGTPGVEVIAAPPMPVALSARNQEDLRHIIPFARSNYDWTVVDLGSGLKPLASGLIAETDETFVVTTMEVPALHQTKTILRALLDGGCERQRLRVLLNRMPKRSEVSLEDLDRMLGVPIYATIPNDYPALYEAYSGGKLLPTDSNLGRHFARVAMRMAGVEPKQKKKRFLFSLS